MKNNLLKFLLCIIMIFTIVPTEKVYAYADLAEFNTYIDNLEITYEDLSLTPKEIEAIKEIQQGGGLTYGMYYNDYTVRMIFEQISKVFDIKVTPVVYTNYTLLLEAVADGSIDFTGSMIPTEERLKLFDFTTSTHEDKTFLFITHENFDLINSKNHDETRVLKIGYPSGFALDGLLSDDFKETFQYELLPINSIEEAVKLVNSGSVDMIFGDITWYGELVSIQNYMALDYSEYINTYFSSNPTKKGTHKELISAINKMYAETNALVELQNQIDNYYEDAALYALHEKYFDHLNHDKINKIYVSDYRPYVYYENGAYTGLAIDLISEIFNAFDLKYEFVSTNMVNADSISDNSFTVTIPILVTDKSKERYNLTIPISESNMTVITMPDDTSKYFTSVESLELQKIGTLNTTYMHDYLDEIFINDDHVKYYSDIDSLVSAIEADEVQFGILPYKQFNKYAIDNQLTDISVLSSLPLPQYPIAFGTPKTESGMRNEAVLSSALSVLNYSDLENKYLSYTPEMQAVYQYRNKVLNSTNHMIVYSALFSIFVLCALIYINQKRANTDYLTKLRNRRTSTAYLKYVKNKNNISVAYIDLDNFKVINDVYGHHYGDEVLIYVANGLLKLSKYSRAFRVGGDEFVIIYNNKQINFHQDIKTILGQTIKIEQTDIKVEGSIGNLNLDKYNYLSVEDVINLSDYAMISAKRRGKNMLVEIDDELVHNYITIRDLRASLEKEQYEESVKLYLESIKDDNHIHGFCLVAKCHHNDNFIDFDELRIHMTNKLVLNKIGLLIFEKLCQSINQMNETSQTKMRYLYELEAESVNDQTIHALGFILAKYNINPEDITLRINPKLLRDGRGQVYTKLLNSLGCKISFDFYQLTGESLLYINYLNFTLVELDLSGLLEFLKIRESNNQLEVFEELKNNLAINKVIELCNLFKVDLLLYKFDTAYLNLIMDYLVSEINAKIYYVEKDKLILLEDFLNELSSIS